MSIPKELLKNYLSVNTYVGKNYCNRGLFNHQDSGTLTSTSWELKKLKVRTISRFVGFFFP